MKCAIQPLMRVCGGLFVPLILASSAAGQSTMTITDLGTLDGVGNSAAHAANDAGQVVGQSQRSDGMTHATLWTKSGESHAVLWQNLPSTASECRNGGWNTYGVFKNQGDCVSFVATRGKNRPG